MKESTFSEKDSLELISQMLKQTKKNLEVGSGNIFLYYGYSAFFISLIVFGLVYFTTNPVWAALWFLMFVPYIIIGIRTKKEKPCVVTYMDKAITNIWLVIGAIFFLTLVAIIIFGLYMKTVNFTFMLPLSLIYAGIGTSITGTIMNEKILVYMPLLGFFIAIYMLLALSLQNVSTTFWHLYFGMAFVFMMIIPGHVINRKSVKLCSRN